MSPPCGGGGDEWRGMLLSALLLSSQKNGEEGSPPVKKQQDVKNFAVGSCSSSGQGGIGACLLLSGVVNGVLFLLVPSLQ